MRRREFIAGLGSAAAWPVAARAQQAAMPVIGYLDGGGPPTALSLAAFREGLNEFGYVEGRNLAIEFRVADQYDRLPALALELARLRVAVIVAATSSNSVRAAKAATSTIPIVFVSGGDPVRLGFVASMNRPGGNITGVSQYTGALVPKRLQFLHELLPRLATIGFLTNPTALASEPDVADVQEAARTLALQLIVLKASTAEQIDAAFATLAQRQVGALLIDTDGFFTTKNILDQLADLSARHKIPASSSYRGFPDAGGLMSYSDDRLESRRQAGRYVGRILKGEKAGELPVQQPTKFQLVINLKTANALGLTIPEALLATADEVIQ